MLSELANNLLLIAQTKHLLKLAINKLIPGSIDNDTPFRDYPDILDEYEPAPQPVQDEGFRDVISVGDGMVDEINMGEKYYTPATYQLTCKDNIHYRNAGYIDNLNGWTYNMTTNYLTSPLVNDSGYSYCKFVVEHWNYIDNNDVYLRVNTIQDAESGCDYGSVVISTLGDLDTNSSYDLRDIARGGTLPSGTGVATVVYQIPNSNTPGTDYSIDCSGGIASHYDNVYVYFVYSKDGSASSGRDNVQIKLIDGYFEQTIVTPEVVYYNDTIE